jgi:hypothetical protein
MPAPHSCLSFRKAKARAKTRIGLAKTAVMRVLLDNLQNGTRTATVSQEEIARSGSFHPIYVRRLLRGLDRDDHLVQRVKRQGVSMYRLSRALLPDYVPDAPRPERIPIEPGDVPQIPAKSPRIL